MSAKAERFIVVSIGDTGGDGFDERSLPILLRLVDSCRPDHRGFTHTGVVGYFRTSKKNLDVVRTLIADAERLRAEDSRFDRLKIGLAEGELIGEFDWRGRVESDVLIGEAIVEAVTAERSLMAYREKLEFITQSLHAGNG